MSIIDYLLKFIKKEGLRFKKLIYFPQYKKNKLDFIKILGKAKTL